MSSMDSAGSFPPPSYDNPANRPPPPTSAIPPPPLPGSGATRGALPTYAQISAGGSSLPPPPTDVDAPQPPDLGRQVEEIQMAVRAAGVGEGEWAGAMGEVDGNAHCSSWMGTLCGLPVVVMMTPVLGTLSAGRSSLNNSEGGQAVYARDMRSLQNFLAGDSRVAAVPVRAGGIVSNILGNVTALHHTVYTALACITTMVGLAVACPLDVCNAARQQLRPSEGYLVGEAMARVYVFLNEMDPLAQRTERNNQRARGAEEEWHPTHLQSPNPQYPVHDPVSPQDHVHDAAAPIFFGPNLPYDPVRDGATFLQETVLPRVMGDEKNREAVFALFPVSILSVIGCTTAYEFVYGESKDMAFDDLPDFLSFEAKESIEKLHGAAANLTEDDKVVIKQVISNITLFDLYNNPTLADKERKNEESPYDMAVYDSFMQDPKASAALGKPEVQAAINNLRKIELQVREADRHEDNRRVVNQFMPSYEIAVGKWYKDHEEGSPSSGEGTAV